MTPATLRATARSMSETLPAMRARHAKELRELIEAQAKLRITQTDASKALGISHRALNNICQRWGIFWPVKHKSEAAQ